MTSKSKDPKLKLANKKFAKPIKAKLAYGGERVYEFTDSANVGPTAIRKEFTHLR